MITEILKKAIEIEGLARIIRDGDPFPETFALLRKKTTLLAGLVDDLKAEPRSAPEAPAISDTDVEAAAETAAETEISVEIPSYVAMEEEMETESHTVETATADEAAPDEDDILLSLAVGDEVEDVSEETAVTRQPVTRQPGHPRPSLRSLFTLNDRFLYARELFNGNMKMFDATLRHLEGIQEMSVVEEYFIDELDWDPEAPVVAQFLDTLRPHFR